MNRIMTLAAGFLLAAATLSAQQPKKTPGIICMKDGSEQKYESIEISKKSGDFLVKKVGEKAVTQISREKVKWAWVPKPKEISDLEKKSGATAEEYLAVGKEFRRLSWEPYCVLKAVNLYKKAGDNAKLLALLENFKDYKGANPKNEKEVMEAYEVLINLYLENKDFDKAIPVAEKLTQSRNEEVACSAFLSRATAMKGKAMATNDKELMKSAALGFFQAALLFPKAGEKNAEALYQSYLCMKDANDARAQKFADLLKKNYPRSEQAQKVK